VPYPDPNRYGLIRFASDVIRAVVFLPFYLLALVGLVVEAAATGVGAGLIVYVGGALVTSMTGTDHLMPTLTTLAVAWGAAVFFVAFARFVYRLLAGWEE